VCAACAGWRLLTAIPATNQPEIGRAEELLMHVLVAGATGAVGRRIVPLLLGRGDRVTGLTRSAARATVLRAAVVDPIVVDVVDGKALTDAVRAATPDVILHQLTDLTGQDRAANARLRTIGTRNLVDAARAAGTRRIVAQSIAFGYQDGPVPATEDVPLRAGLAGVPELESAVAELPEWVVLRYGLFYGPGTWYSPDGPIAERARAGELVADESVASFVHIDDAAAASVVALDWPSGPVNICDDEPAAASAWVPVFCDAVEAPPPPRAATRSPGSRGANNHRARSRGWRPAVPSWREGFRAFAGAVT
jgi:nucleoside-diphosphate-sugar epimerase